MPKMDSQPFFYSGVGANQPNKHVLLIDCTRATVSVGALKDELDDAFKKSHVKSHVTKMNQTYPTTTRCAKS
jgi:hypothetical protein